MKTSGFREIDFSKTECKNCGINNFSFNSMGMRLFAPEGKIYTTEYLDCPKCNGLGYTDESGATELELE